MENLCDIPVEKLPFELFGLCLQEPMAMNKYANCNHLLYHLFKNENR